MNKKSESVKELLRENFESYRAKDLVVLRKLQKSSGLNEDDLVELLTFWHSCDNPKESLLDFLVGQRILSTRAKESLKGKKISLYHNLDDFLNHDQLNQVKIQIVNCENERQHEQNNLAADDGKITSKGAVIGSPSEEKNRAATSTVPRVGMRLGKCLLTDIIGKGTSSIVFKGLHETLQIPVAIKVFLPQNNSQAEVIRQQFGAEAQTLAKLNHRSIVRILDFEDGLHPYLTLEYVDGKPMNELIRERGRIDYQQAAYYIYCVAGGLVSAHESGVIHRDIKPANILITKNDTAKLADLGIAHIIHSTQMKEYEQSKTPPTLPGTPAYIAPELAFTELAGDARSDIYSLGATFYHAVTGKYPFEGDSAYMIIMKHVHEPLVPTHDVVPEIPKQMSDLIEKMMAKKPEDRFQTVEDLLPDLLSFFLGSGLYSVNEDLRPVNGSSSGPLYGTKTRILFNVAKKIMASSRSPDQTDTGNITSEEAPYD